LTQHMKVSELQPREKMEVGPVLLLEDPLDKRRGRQQPK
jgi:hypothetical protein